jgi:hypothetical protein
MSARQLPEALARAVAGREPALRAALIGMRGLGLLQPDILLALATALKYCPDCEAIQDLVQRAALLQFDPQAYDQVRRVNKRHGWEPTSEAVGRLLSGWARREFCARAGTKPKPRRRRAGGVA